MNEKSFDLIEKLIDKLKLEVQTNNQERIQFLEMKLQELQAVAKNTNHDTTVFAEYICDVGKGVLPLPEVISHEYPNYPVFRTYKDGSFESGDYEVWQLWRMKQLDPQVMSKPSRKKILTLVCRNLLVFGGGGLSALFIGFGLFWVFDMGIVRPSREFITWWNQDRQIDSPWVRQPYTVYTLEELQQKEQNNGN